ncbi:MAG TPA: XdhC/CoxI family protein [Kofleriaceae bacterium]|nr:XdhC/CoxI family protein [Kofleriaceae bacterium]
MGGHDLEGVLAQAAAWRAEGRGVALATVIRTWGSSPRQPGSRLAVEQGGAFVGSVSGGCIEAAVIHDAQEVMAEGTSRVLAFGVSDESAWEVGLACGGKIEVFVEAVAPERGRGLSRELLGEIIAARREPRAAVLATWLDGSAHLLLSADPAHAPAELAAAVRGAVGSDQATVVDTEAGAVFLEPHLPPLRLVVVGAVHVAQPLAEMAALAGFAVTIVDPRRAFATEARFPGRALVTRWPDEALAEIRPDARTAIVTLTHDPKLDDPALVAALGSPAFYVGCLGSQKTHAARKARLGERGVAAAALERLRGPVGLRIGARTPAEIAVSILAEIIATLRGAP